MKYRMLAIDLDGTLFDSDGVPTEPNIRAIERAEQAGMLVVFCTGRGLAESRPAIRKIGHEAPIVLAGGAMVSDPTTGRTLHRATIEPHLALQIVEQLDPQTHAVLVLVDPEPAEHDYVIIGAQNLTDNTRWWFDMIGAQLRYADDPAPDDLHHTVRVGIVGPARIMPEAQQSVSDRFGEQVFVQHFMAVKQDSDEDVHVLEIFAPGVNKWSGLKWLAAEHDIALDEIAAIGDHVNDVAMIEQAACGIAMANAVEPVRRIADRLTLANNDHGVAHAIEQLLTGAW